MSTSTPPKAMILAAGVGVRLRPLTLDRAKPSLRLMGRPLIDYTVRLLQEAGVRDVVINLHHRPESIKAALGEGNEREVRLHYAFEPNILGTAGGLKAVESFLDDRSFLLFNGDTLADLDVPAFLAAHRRHRARGGKATLLLRPKPTGTDYTDVGMSEDARLLPLGSSAPSSSPTMFAGVWALEPELLQRLASGQFAQLEKVLLPGLIDEGTAYGYLFEGPWFDVGTPRRYIAACRLLARDHVLERHWLADQVEPPPPSPQRTVVVAGRDTVIDPESRFSGESVLGRSCQVGRAARIHGAVLWDDVVVGEGCLIRHSIIADGVRVPPGMRVTAKVIARLPKDSAAFRTTDRVGDCLVTPIRT